MDTSITERQTIAMDAVESSQIAAIGHDPESNTLAIKFPPNRAGKSSVYHYANFTVDQFQEFKNAESKGSFFGKRIKKAADQFPYVNVTTLYEDAETDTRIRAALRNANNKGELSTVAAVTGIAGGEGELRKIMNSTDPLHVMDRGMLGIHLAA